MKIYDLTDIQFTYENIQDVFDKCLHLEKFSDPEDILDNGVLYQAETYADISGVFSYRVIKGRNKLQLLSGDGLVIEGDFDEKEYVLKVLQVAVQKSKDFEAKITDSNKIIFSIIGNKPAVKYTC